MWSVYKQILDNVVEEFVIKIKIRWHNKLKWLDHKCIRAFQLKNKRWKKFAISCNCNDCVEYLIARNKTVKAVRKAKLKFEKTLAR